MYSTNLEMSNGAPHVRHRRFTPWVEENCPQWQLTQVAGAQRAANRPGRLLRVRARERQGRLTTVPKALLLTPSRGLGGGIERYVETVEGALASTTSSASRLDLHAPARQRMPG